MSLPDNARDALSYQFCPCCFADEQSGSWNHVVVPTTAGGHCSNCGNGDTVLMPSWVIKEIRRNASWVGRRYYPNEEDREAAQERMALLALVTQFPGRHAQPDETDEAGRWWVFQKLPSGSTTSTSVVADSAEDAMRKCGLRYVPKDKL